MLKDNIINLRNSRGYSQEDVAEKIVIPKKARDIMGYKPGDNLIVLGDEESGLALMKSSDFMRTMLSLIKAAKKKN